MGQKDTYNLFMNLFFKQIRKNKGLTQLELAKKLGTHRSYVSKIENEEREISLKGFIAYCKALEIDPVTTLKTHY